MKVFKYIHIVAFILFVSQSLPSVAQGIKIVKVEEITTGMDAFNAPRGSNGDYCGLVKVSSVIPDLNIDGEIVGDITYDNNEYKVYLCKGSKSITIKRPQSLPAEIQFNNYGIEEISSKASYRIVVKDVPLNREKNKLHINVKPNTSKVFIDNHRIDNEAGDGDYTLFLPKGEYVCKLENVGYRSIIKTFKVGKEPVDIQVSLESLLADLEIDCSNSMATISINDKIVAKGSWKGKLPAGTYHIVVEQEGFVPTSKSIVLDEKDNQKIIIPQLKRAKGSLYIVSSFKNAESLLDGNKINLNRIIENIQTGNHILRVRAPFGYKEIEQSITISSGKVDTISVEMEPINELYKKAFEGDATAQVELCHKKIESSKYNANDSIERNYWYDRIYENIDNIEDSALEKLLYEEGMELCGMYDYFKTDHEKSLKILQKWNRIGHYEYEKVAWHYYYLGKYDDAIKWGTKAIPYSDYDYYFCDVINKACNKLNDIERGISIIMRTTDNDWDDGAKFTLFEGIGDLYKEHREFTKALPYYRKCIQLLQGSLSIYDDWVKESINKKIKECQ